MGRRRRSRRRRSSSSSSSRAGCCQRKRMQQLSDVCRPHERLGEPLPLLPKPLTEVLHQRSYLMQAERHGARQADMVFRQRQPGCCCPPCWCCCWCCSCSSCCCRSCCCRSCSWCCCGQQCCRSSVAAAVADSSRSWCLQAGQAGPQQLQQRLEGFEAAWGCGDCRQGARQGRQAGMQAGLSEAIKREAAVAGSGSRGLHRATAARACRSASPPAIST